MIKLIHGCVRLLNPPRLSPPRAPSGRLPGTIPQEHCKQSGRCAVARLLQAESAQCAAPLSRPNRGSGSRGFPTSATWRRIGRRQSKWCSLLPISPVAAQRGTIGAFVDTFMAQAAAHEPLALKDRVAQHVTDDDMLTSDGQAGLVQLLVPVGANDCVSVRCTAVQSAAHR